METQASKSKNAQPSQTLEIDKLGNLLGIPADLDFESDGHAYSCAYKEATEEAERNDASNDEAIELATKEGEKAEQAEQDEAYRQHVSAFEHAADDAFEHVGLALEWHREKGTVKVIPKTTWQNAAAQIKEVINGDGFYGHFATLAEFLASGPWTARQAVLAHLGWIKRYADVYGGASPRAVYNGGFR